MLLGAENAVLLCVVRNVGSAPLPENLLRLRCYPISGLDYTNGNLLPILPALAPGQAVAYRWRFASSEGRNALVAGVVLEKTEGEKRRGGEEETGEGKAGDGIRKTEATPSATENRQSAIGNSTPQLAFAVVPRLPRPLTLGDVPVLKTHWHMPGNRARRACCSTAALRAGPDGERRETRTGAGRERGRGVASVANSLVPLRVCVGEDGQSALVADVSLPAGTLPRRQRPAPYSTLTGNVGTACRAEITLEARPDTCVLIGKVRLTALRALRLSGIQLPALQTVSDDKTLPAPRADGSPSLLPEPPALIPDDARPCRRT